jgi:hypothetical protein
VGLEMDADRPVATGSLTTPTGDLVGRGGEPLGNERANRKDQVRPRFDNMGGKLRVGVRLTIGRVAFDQEIMPFLIAEPTELFE